MNFYEAIYKIFARPVRALYRVRVIGAENLPAEGGCLLCSNHTSMRDVVVLAAALPRQPRYMAKKELFKIPLLSQLIRALGAFPVDRGGADVSSIKKSIAMIEGGEVVSVFPQGHRVKGRCADNERCGTYRVPLGRMRRARVHKDQGVPREAVSPHRDNHRKTDRKLRPRLCVRRHGGVFRGIAYDFRRDMRPRRRRAAHGRCMRRGKFRL